VQNFWSVLCIAPEWFELAVPLVIFVLFVLLTVFAFVCTNMQLLSGAVFVCCNASTVVLNEFTENVRFPLVLESPQSCEIFSCFPRTGKSLKVLESVPESP